MADEESDLDQVARWHTYFQTKNSNLGKFWRVLQCKMLVYVMAIRSILLPFVIHCGHFFGIFSRFGLLYQEKSGNPDLYRGKKVLLVENHTTNTKYVWTKNKSDLGM
jgi:hypothetical protein